MTKEDIRRWLDNYAELGSGGGSSWKGPDASPSKVTKAVNDGVSYGRLNKIMLKQAIEHLDPELQAVVFYRWIKKPPLSEILRELGISKDVYYARCSKALNKIHKFLS